MINDVCLSESERHRLEQELGADEQLRLLLRPRPEPEEEVNMPERWISIIFLLVCLVVTIGMAEENPLSCVLMLPAWLAGLFAFRLPWLRRRCRLRTLYVITDRRVLLWEPKFYLMVRLRSFPLQSGMVQEVACKPGGYGNLVFAYTRDERNGAREERVARQVGFIDIPQVRHVQTILRETIAEYERKLARNNR